MCRKSVIKLFYRVFFFFHFNAVSVIFQCFQIFSFIYGMPKKHRNQCSSPIQRTTRIDVYETLCPQQMLVHKGGKIKNWGGECRDVTPTKLQSQNIFKESTGRGSDWGVRMDVNEELKFL